MQSQYLFRQVWQVTRAIRKAASRFGRNMLHIALVMKEVRGWLRLTGPKKVRYRPAPRARLLRSRSTWLPLSLDGHAQRSLKLIESFQVHYLSTNVPPAPAICATLITSSTAYGSIQAMTSETSIGLLPFLEFRQMLPYV